MEEPRRAPELPLPDNCDSHDARTGASAAQGIAERLGSLIGQRRFDAWFGSRVQFSTIEQGELRLTVANTVLRDCIQRQFRSDLQQACELEGLGRRQVVVVVDDAEAVPKPTPAPCSANPPRRMAAPQRPPASTVQATSAFSEVVIGDSNSAAVSVAQQIAAGQQTASPILFWGPTGVGKTQLIRAIRQEVRQLGRRIRALYITAEQFTTEFVEAMYGRGLPNFRTKLRGVELLLIDDLQFFAGKKKTAEELLHTIDALSAAGASIVLAADRPLGEMVGLENDLLSRIGSGVSVSVDPADPDMRLQIAERLAAESEASFSAEVFEALATGVAGGARELRGVVNRLSVSQGLTGREVDLAAARKAIDDVHHQSTPQVDLSKIQTAVCRVCHIDPRTLKSEKRTRAVAEPRMLAMWLARKYTRAALSEIGQHFGRSHSTVVSACNRVDNLLADGQLQGADMQQTLRRVELALRTA